MSQEPQTNQPPATTGDRYCKRCKYCLGDLSDPNVPEVCPECGRGFDRSDPKTTLSEKKRGRPLLLRPSVLFMVLVLALVALSGLNMLPQPVSGYGGRLWNWQNHIYGYGDGFWWWIGDAYGTRSEQRNGVDITLTMRDGIARRIVAVDPTDGHHAFTVTRTGEPPVWSIKVDDHDLAWPHGGGPELIRAINLTREFRFGVRLEVPEGAVRLTPPGPIEVTGTEADILWGYANAYGLVLDFPELVPRTSDGWHPTLQAGETVDYPPTNSDPNARSGNRVPANFYRGR